MHYRFGLQGKRKTIRGARGFLPPGWARILISRQDLDYYKGGPTIRFVHDTHDTVYYNRAECFGESLTKATCKYNLSQWTRQKKGQNKCVNVPGYTSREWAVVMKHLRDDIARPAFLKYS